MNSISKKLNISFFIDYMTFPPVAGGQKAKYYRVIELAKYHNILIITTIFNKTFDHESEPAYTKLRSNIDILLYDRVIKEFKKSNLIRKIFIFIKWLTSGKTYNEFIFSSKDNQKIISDYLLTKKPDILFIETIYFTDLINIKFLKENNIKSILVLHNVDSIFFKKTTIPETILTNPLIQLEIKRIEKLEEFVLKNVDLIIGISDFDVNYFRNKYKLNNIYYKPVLLPLSKNLWSHNNDSNYIVFSGALSFYSNIEGLKWFLDNIFNDFINDYPNVKLKVTGKVPANIYKKFQCYNNIEFTGFLSMDEMNKLISNSLFGIVPIIKGTGIKIKLLELLSIGVPAVTTTEAARGIPYDKDHPPFLIAKNEMGFLNNMNELMVNIDLKINLSEQALNFFKKEYEIEVNVDKWLEIIDAGN